MGAGSYVVAMTSTLSPTTGTTPRPLTPSRPRLPLWARCLIVMLCMPVPLLGLLAVNQVARLFIRDPQALSIGTQAIIGAAINLTPVFFGVLVVWALMRFIDRRPLREAGVLFTARSLPLWALGLVVSAAVVAVPAYALWQAGLLRAADPIPLTWYSPVIALSMGWFAQGFPEEILWRGYLLQTMRERPLTAVLVSAALFGSLHYFSDGGQQNLGERFIYLGAAAAFGLLAGVLAVSFRSVWPAIGVHCGNHLGYFIADTIGTGAGPWLWASEIVLYVALSAICYAANRKQFSRPIHYVN